MNPHDAGAPCPHVQGQGPAIQTAPGVRGGSAGGQAGLSPCRACCGEGTAGRGARHQLEPWQLGGGVASLQAAVKGDAGDGAVLAADGGPAQHMSRECTSTQRSRWHAERSAAEMRAGSGWHACRLVAGLTGSSKPGPQGKSCVCHVLRYTRVNHVVATWSGARHVAGHTRRGGVRRSGCAGVRRRLDNRQPGTHVHAAPVTQYMQAGHLSGPLQLAQAVRPQASATVATDVPPPLSPGAAAALRDPGSAVARQVVAQRSPCRHACTHSHTYGTGGDAGSLAVFCCRVAPCPNVHTAGPWAEGDGSAPACTQCRCVGDPPPQSLAPFLPAIAPCPCPRTLFECVGAEVTCRMGWGQLHARQQGEDEHGGLDLHRRGRGRPANVRSGSPGVAPSTSRSRTRLGLASGLGGVADRASHQRRAAPMVVRRCMCMPAAGCPVFGAA